jgi:hypothetical protein
LVALQYSQLASFASFSHQFVAIHDQLVASQVYERVVKKIDDFDRNRKYKVTTPPIKKSKKSLTGFWGLKIEMTLLQLIVLFIGMPRSLQRISQGVTDFASKNRF